MPRTWSNCNLILTLSIIVILIIQIYNSVENTTTQKNKNENENEQIEGGGFRRKHRVQLEHFNKTNPYAQWCPAATCHNSPICSPCNRRFLFILATARSGSTTILQTLNELPGVRLSGENNNLFYNLWKLINYGGIKTTLRQNYDQNSSFWIHNAVPRGAMACTIQNFMETINPPPLLSQKYSKLIPLSKYDDSKIIGAKMIRVQKDNNKWKPKFVADFIRENFPCAKFVVNIRSDVQSQLKSQETTFVKHLNNTTNPILQQNIFLLSLAEEIGENAIQIDMMEWSKDVSVLNNVFKWIGFQGCTLETVIHTNDGKDGFQQEAQEKRLFGPTCHYPHLQ